MRSVPRTLALATVAVVGFSGLAPVVAAQAAPGATSLVASAAAVNQLSSGAPVAVTGQRLAFQMYTIEVPSDATSLTVTIGGGTGDADLYVRKGAEPTATTYDCRPYKAGNAETCTLAVTGGTYYIGVRGYEGYSGVTLTATHNGAAAPSTTTAPTSTSSAPTPTTTPGGSVLTNGTPVTVAGAQGAMTYWSFTVPVGASNLTVATSGGTGDVDLYLRAGSQPTATAYDCRPYKAGNAETCTVASPVAGTYWVGLRGYSSFSGVTLTASWTEPTTTSVPSTSTSPTSTATTGPTTPAPGGNLPTGPWGDDLSLATSVPNEDSKYPEMSNPELDALRYHLDLDWDGSTLKGRTTLVFRATKDTSTVRLDLLNALKVSALTVDGQAVTWTTDPNGLVIKTGSLSKDSRHTAVITYAGTPTTVPMPSHRSDVDGMGFTLDKATGEVSTMQEPYGAFTWYPCNDTSWDKAYYSATLTANSGKQGVFNGSRVSSTTTDAGRSVNTFVLDKPVSAYLTTYAVGAYQLETRTMNDGTPFNLWYLPADKTRLPGIWSNITKSWNWLTDTMAPYPFATAGAVIVSKGSAMETQTMVTINRSYASTGAVMMHESAHQWNGDSVTPQDWRDLWLSEGWAMYWEMEFSGGYSDSSVATYCKNSVADAGAAGDYDKMSFGEHNVYMCGARALRQIRQDVGTAKFTTMAKGWQEHKQYSTASRADFVAYVKSSTGYDPTSVLDNWLGANPR